MADSSSSPLPKGSSALNVIQDVAESAPASPSSASSLGSPRPQHYDVDIEDVPRSAFGTPSVERSTCAAGLEDLYQTDSEAVMVAVVLSTTVAAAAGAFLSPILAGVAISIGGSAGIFFLVRSPRLKPRPKSSGEFL
ncbi:hypothetical protein FOL46_000472 [Perkinsus olseni]|uniref:Uncharacterized protein n=1 Tax=Perkinsus olseni TaxID=32597 RepID=A0A7J6MWA1_PEROL|nr:hypothetical protein FOL46_000472 [Perkinsus olseni]